MLHLNIKLHKTSQYMYAPLYLRTFKTEVSFLLSARVLLLILFVGYFIFIGFLKHITFIPRNLFLLFFKSDNPYGSE